MPAIEVVAHSKPRVQSRTSRESMPREYTGCRSVGVPLE